MSKYTTEVRYICETYAGLVDSVEYPSIDEVIENSYLKIFDNSKIPMFKGETEAHRALLLKKILLHYYSREIGYETVGLWKLKLNQKMVEIMPYYNQLYESELIEFDPLKNVDVTHTHEGEYNDDEKVDNLRNTESHKGTHTEQTINTTENATENYSEDISENLTENITENVTENVNENSTENVTQDTTENVTLRHSRTTTQGNDVRTNDIESNGEKWTLFSDTPQGGINGIANASSGSVSDNSYLTNATHEITTPDEQSITQSHGTIVETYNADADKADTTVGHAEVETVGEKSQETTEEKTIAKTAEKTIEKTAETISAKTINSELEKQVNENADGKITDDNTKNTKGTDEYTNKDIGKIGTETYSEMLNKFRDTFLNIDLMVIKELEPLFIGLW